MVGLMVTSSRRAYGTPRSAAPRVPAPAADRPLLTCTFIGDAQTQFWLSLCGVSGSWCTQGMFEPSECLWWVWGLILNVISPLLPFYCGFSSAHGHGVSPQSHSSKIREGGKILSCPTKARTISIRFLSRNSPLASYYQLFTAASSFWYPGQQKTHPESLR